VPIIYFLGISRTPPSHASCLPFRLGSRLTEGACCSGVPDQDTVALPESAVERRYALRAVKQRPHQASFREAVIAAFNGRCALSGLAEPLLLDAAHIVADEHERSASRW
jgi:putative restriction endonuclease